MLELAHGHAPFAKFPPIKVLLMTVQNPPPQLEAERGQRHFSKHMRDLVAQCLQKDPSKRPTASQVLESKFFRSLPDAKYLVNLVKNLPSLSDRTKMLEEGKGETSEDDASEILKCKEGYVRGVSGWNFGDIMAMKQSKPVLASRSPSIQENKGEGSKAFEDAMIRELATLVPEKAQEGSSKPDSVCSPRSDISSLLSPTKRMSDQFNAWDTPHKGHEKNGKSRFRVTTKGGNKSTPYSTSDSSVLPDSHSLVHAKDDTLFTSSELSDYERESHKPVIIGRFRVQDQVVKKEEAKCEKDKRPMTSIATTATGSHFIPPATALSSQLQNFFCAQKQMCQSMERMVDALKEADKGHPAALQTLLASSNSESPEALVRRIKELESENRSLKERNAQLEQRLAHITLSNGPIQFQEKQ